MGNKLGQLNKKIQRDKKGLVNKQYANELMNQSQDEQQQQQEYGDQQQVSGDSNRISESKQYPKQGLIINSQRINNSKLSQINNLKYDSYSINKHSKLLLTILSSVITQQQQSENKITQSRVKYNWIELQEGLLNIQKEIQSLEQAKERNSNNNNINTSITTRNNLLRLKSTLMSVSNSNNNNNNSNNIVYCTTMSIGTNLLQTIHKPILAQRITIDQQQQLLSHQYDEQYNNNTQQQQQQQLGHYIRVNKLLYEWRKRLARVSLKYTQNQLPLVHIYQYQQQLNEQHTITNNILSMFNPNNNNIQKHQHQHPPKLTLYQQHIPHRLSDIRTLTNLQGVYVLQQSLLGFMLLYQVVGQFHIQQDMIGFTHDGVVKVWLSPLFYTNLCQLKQLNREIRFNSIIDKSIVNPQHKVGGYYDLAEKKMVTAIYMMVQKYSLFNKQFITLTRGFRNNTFKQALNLIHSYKYQLIMNSSNRLGEQCYGHKNKDEKVKFVTRLRVQQGWYRGSENSGDYEFYRNNLFMKEAQYNKVNRDADELKVNLNSLLIPPTNKDIIKPSIANIDQLNPHSFPSTANYLYPQKPSAPTMTSLSSHITITNNPTTPRRRPIIFNHGYERSMSNNQNQSIQQLSQHPSYQPSYINNNNNSIISRSYGQKSRVQRQNNNHSEKQKLLKSSATFVTIKSQQQR